MKLFRWLFPPFVIFGVLQLVQWTIQYYPPFDFFNHYYPPNHRFEYMDMALAYVTILLLYLLTASFWATFFLFFSWFAVNLIKIYQTGERLLLHDVYLLDEFAQSIGFEWKLVVFIFLIMVVFFLMTPFFRRHLWWRLSLLGVLVAGYMWVHHNAEIVMERYLKLNRFWLANLPDDEMVKSTGLLFTNYYQIIMDSYAWQRLQNIDPVTTWPDFDYRSYKMEKDIKAEKLPNIHMIVLESFLHPHYIENITFKKDPVPDGFFKELDKRSISAGLGYNTRLTSVSEFEYLCGMPNQENVFVVVFHWLEGEKKECLPQYLNNLGYKTIANHPNYARQYNRKQAYESLQFDEVLFRKDFDMTDNMSGWLSTRSLLEQNFDNVIFRYQMAEPIFNYVLTTQGHPPYKLGLYEVPHIKVRDADLLLPEQFVTILDMGWHVMQALNRYLERLLEKDPDALIILVADHFPYFLSSNHSFFIHENEKRDYYHIFPRNKDYHGRKQTYALFIKGGEVLSYGFFERYNLPNIIADILSGGRFCEERECSHQKPYMLIENKIYDRRFPLTNYDYCEAKDICDKPEKIIQCLKRQLDCEEARERMVIYKRMYRRLMDQGKEK